MIHHTIICIIIIIVIFHNHLKHMRRITVHPLRWQKWVFLFIKRRDTFNLENEDERDVSWASVWCFGPLGFGFVPLCGLTYMWCGFGFVGPGFGEGSPEKKAARNLQHFFNYIAVRVVLTQLEVPTLHSIYFIFSLLPSKVSS